MAERTVLTDDGTLEWRIGDAKAPVDSIQVRNVALGGDWTGVYGGNSVAVTLDRIRAWADLLRGARPRRSRRQSIQRADTQKAGER